MEDNSVKLVFLMTLVFLSLVGCGKDRHPQGEDYGYYDQYQWPNQSPEIVVVQRNPTTGEVYYTTVSSNYTTYDLENLVRNNGFSFQYLPTGSRIANSYPAAPREGLYFLEDIYCGCSSDDYYHYYPQNWGGYSNYWYYPSFYYSYSYYYYLTYHNYLYGGYEYYFYARY